MLFYIWLRSLYIQTILVGGRNINYRVCLQLYALIEGKVEGTLFVCGLLKYCVYLRMYTRKTSNNVHAYLYIITG